jgi:hypothetical protein
VAAVLRWLAFRSRHIEPMPVKWRKVSGPYFGNAIAVLRTRGRRAEMVVERAEAVPDGPPRLDRLATVTLTEG